MVDVKYKYISLMAVARESKVSYRFGQEPIALGNSPVQEGSGALA